MKSIRDIEKLSVEDLLNIGDNEHIPVPADLAVRLPSRNRRTYFWSAAAAIAILVAGVAGLHRPGEPKDTFDDPYLAYATVEQALGRISGTMNQASAKVQKAEATIDKVNYWK